MKNNAGRTIFLSRAERRRGGRYFLRFSGMNGLGISFLGDTPVYLLAVYFQATNFQLGLISAMIHISGLVLLVIPQIFHGYNVISVGFWSWFIRGLVSLGYAGLFFLEGQRAVTLTITIYALFCLSRMVGVSMVNTIQKRLTTASTQGDVVFKNSASFQGSSMISRVISFLVLSIQPLSELLGVLTLQVMGVAANTAAALLFRRIPNRTRVVYQKGLNLFVILKRSLAVPLTRQVLLARWIGLSLHILFGLSIPFLRRSAGLPSSQVLLFTLAAGFASFTASLSLRAVVERAGSRPLLFFASLPLTLILGGWVLLPTDQSLELYLVLGFVTWFLLTASILAVNRLLMRVTPEDNAVGFNAMETFVTAIFALVLSFAAGGLGDISAALSPHWPINDFGLIFLLAAFCSLLLVFLALRIREPNSFSLLEALRLLTHAGNLRAWKSVRVLDTTADPARRRTILVSLGHSRAPAANEEIRRILAEPLSSEKEEIITTLFERPRPGMRGELLREAEDVYAYHRVKAVFALGAYPGKKTAALLEQLLDDKDPLIRSAAAKSLGRVGAKEPMEKIYALAKNAVSLREILDYMIALYHMDPQKEYLYQVFSPASAAGGEALERPLFTLAARQFGMEPPLGALYREERLKKNSGLFVLLEEARETTVFLEQNEAIVQQWEEGDYLKIWNICQSALIPLNPPPELLPLKEALGAFPSERADHANTLAVLYFTYQLLTAREGLDLRLP